MDYHPVIERLLPYRLIASALHGPAHWARVHHFGTLLAEELRLTPAQRHCVEVFAWTHDLARQDDGGGNRHAIDGAAYLATVFPDTRPDQTRGIAAAVRYHADGMVAVEAYERGLLECPPWEADTIIRTVGCCWDADRLDLLRLARAPRAPLMSTPGWEAVLPLARKLHRAPGG